MLFNIPSLCKDFGIKYKAFIKLLWQISVVVLWAWTVLFNETVKRECCYNKLGIISLPVDNITVGFSTNR